MKATGQDVSSARAANRNSRVAVYIPVMEYDNHTFVVRSSWNEPVTVTVSVKGSAKEPRNRETGKMIRASALPTGAHRWRNHGIPGAEQRTSFQITLQPHSFEAFATASRK